ncbi:lipoprotein insertase outer membrane protein LolB [Pseudoxanthomonas dokdonensis]|uniref:Outer-membrane lipoprotein LolB n=1 Tax=Pseudoxanthomonas dokdonensis TaxID=344882 RepID=A0A0R0CNK5_9GAMM|nr:lipoprotein insertase outer membrane protein LolB [Pseudoxanthomonas dokdonensis]KRG67374.1 hypothetical protein ABB29_15715 [Pseudoxanthomonas dokdonensis]
MKTWHVLPALVLLGLLAGCASRGPSVAGQASLTDPQALAAAQAGQATRSAWLRTHPQWSFQGRVAISQNGKGGNGRMDWQQDGDSYQVSLSAPITRQSWQLHVDPQGARLLGLEGGERSGPDAAALLQAATGWQVPVQALSDWARGMAAEGMAGESRYNLQGQLQHLQQQGWQVDYAEWLAPQGDQPAMPRRIEAARGEAKVRLIIDQWSLEAGP